MTIRRSGEDYLETILILTHRNGVVHAVDIAAELSFSKPSVSRAMGILKRAGYITVKRGGEICLTPCGLIKATDIYDRHRTLTAFLSSVLSIDVALAERDACMIEHDLSEETYAAICAFVKRQSIAQK